MFCTRVELTCLGAILYFEWWSGSKCSLSPHQAPKSYTNPLTATRTPNLSKHSSYAHNVSLRKSSEHSRFPTWTWEQNPPSPRTERLHSMLLFRTGPACPRGHRHPFQGLNWMWFFRHRNSLMSWFWWLLPYSRDEMIQTHVNDRVSNSNALLSKVCRVWTPFMN